MNEEGRGAECDLFLGFACFFRLCPSLSLTVFVVHGCLKNIVQEDQDRDERRFKPERITYGGLNGRRT